MGKQHSSQGCFGPTTAPAASIRATKKLQLHSIITTMKGCLVLTLGLGLLSSSMASCPRCTYDVSNGSNACILGSGQCNDPDAVYGSAGGCKECWHCDAADRQNNQCPECINASCFSPSDVPCPGCTFDVSNGSNACFEGSGKCNDPAAVYGSGGGCLECWHCDANDRQGYLCPECLQQTCPSDPDCANTPAVVPVSSFPASQTGTWKIFFAPNSSTKWEQWTTTSTGSYSGWGWGMYYGPGSPANNFTTVGTYTNYSCNTSLVSGTEMVMSWWSWWHGLACGKMRVGCTYEQPPDEQGVVQVTSFRTTVDTSFSPGQCPSTKSEAA